MSNQQQTNLQGPVKEYPAKRKRVPVGFRKAKGIDFIEDGKVKFITTFWRWNPYKGGRIKENIFLRDFDDIDWLVNEIDLGNIFIREDGVRS